MLIILDQYESCTVIVLNDIQHRKKPYPKNILKSKYAIYITGLPTDKRRTIEEQRDSVDHLSTLVTGRWEGREEGSKSTCSHSISASQRSSVDTDTIRKQELGPKRIREVVRATGFISS